MRNLRLKAPASVVADCFHLFVNRRAYTLQSNRPHPESSRHYYYRPEDKKTGKGLSLTLDTIRRHLGGEITIGLYAINPATQCSKWVAIDADYEDALADLLKLSFYLRQDGVDSALEKSHRADISGYSWRNRSQRGIAVSTFVALPCSLVSRSREASGGKESRTLESASAGLAARET
jgi:hypothetical protein